MTSLSDIQEQKKVYLIEINGSGQNINRLETLGFVPGTEITVLQNAGRGPMVVTIKGSKIALGRGMAHRIQVAETREQQMETRLYAQDSELKRTKQRDVILKVISGLEGHQTTEEIAEAVKKQDASIGMTTVYRTLKIFEEAHLIRALTLEDGITRYELVGGSHAHFICLGCGDIIEFAGKDLHIFEQKIASQHQVRVERSKLEMYGYCSRCNLKKG